MVYKVFVTQNAEADLESFVRYLAVDKLSPQAAVNVLVDYEATIEVLTRVAGSLRLCYNSKLSALGYRRINFLNHKYFMLYRIENDTVFVDNIYHASQDYEYLME
ncbi:MAG: type II toxin-antitoxin system RelE/ParE family toxin [Saccharofermentans sp.]|nr:type II toxin-antitoxin system RelE/ParE family toxin [Saccharofermentans sp.]